MPYSVDGFRSSEALPAPGLHPTEYLSCTTTCREPRSNKGGLVRRSWPVRTGTMQALGYELPRKPLLGAWVHKEAGGPCVLRPPRGRPSPSPSTASASTVAVQPRGHWSTGYARTAEASTW